MSFLEVFQHKNMLHAAAVHTPIVFALIGVPLVLASVLFRRVLWLRLFTILNYVLLIASALFAERTGEGARSLVSATLPPEIWKLIEQHEAMAERVKLFGIAVLVLMGLSMIPNKKARITFSILALIASMGCFYVVTNAAHYGGTLVYHHGVGTPFRETMTPGVAPVFPSPVTPAPQPLPAPPAAPAMAAPAPVEDPVAPTASVVEEPPAPAAVSVAQEAAAVSMALDVAAVPAETLQLETPAQEVNTAVLPVSDALNNPAWIPVRPIDLVAAKQIVFSRDIWPILEDQCVDCHSDEDADGGYDVTTRANLLKRGEKGGAGVVPGDPDNSALIHYIRGIMQPQMPKKSPPLSEDQVHLFRSWIAAGAEVDAEPGA